MDGWAILQATKHKTILRLVTILPLVALVIGLLLPVPVVDAASSKTPKQPITWDTTDHGKATDANGNVYYPIGYACLPTAGLNIVGSGPTAITNAQGTSISASAEPTTSIDAVNTSELADTILTVPTPACGPEIGGSLRTTVAPYVWVTKTSPHYALIVENAGTLNNNTKICPIRVGQCKATVQKLDNGGSLTGNVLVTATSMESLKSGTGDSVPPAATPSDGSGGNETPSCESHGFSLSWIMCGFINGLASAVDSIYGTIIQPLLKTSPIVTSVNGDPTNIYKIWSNFRIYGNIFLIIALLVIVFGESIGGGLIPAYAAKKILPRLLVAAVLINVSIYIVAFMVDLTNIVGNGIYALLTQPFVDAGSFTLTLSGGTSATVGAAAGGVATLGIGVFITSIWGALSVGAGLAALWPLVQFLLVFILLPAFLAFIGILVTILIRRGLIIFLVVISPIAFALYCLPNTEQYFRKWWDLLFKTLLVYPIIAVVFAMANILAVTINQAGQTSGLADWAASLMSIAALVIPLFLIPFSFKIAGGIIGQVSVTAAGIGKRATEVVKGNPNDPNSLRNRTKRNAKGTLNEQRATAYGVLSEKTKAGENGGRNVRRKLYKGAAGVLNYGNLQADRARITKERAEIIGAQTSTGNDDNVRAFWAKQYDGTGEANGRINGAWYSPYQNQDGSYKEWSGSEVAKARSIVGKDQSALQQYGTYEVGKMADDDQFETFQRRYVDVANELGFGRNQVQGAWAGIKYAQQQTRKEAKFETITGDPGSFDWGETDDHGLSRELTDTMRMGDFAGFRSRTAKEALRGYNDAVGRGGASENGSAEDQEIVRNYKNLAGHLETSLFGPGASSEAARQAAQAAMQATAADGETPGSAGYGVGASQRATDAWKEFVTTVQGSGGSASADGPIPPPANSTDEPPFSTRDNL